MRAKKGHANKINRICKECGKSFLVWPMIVRIGKGYFCSAECRKKRAGDKIKGKRRRPNSLIDSGSHYKMVIKTKYNGIKEVLFDKQDLYIIESHTWHINNTGYTQSGAKSKELLHRLIMNTPPDKDTDHRNRNKLDNRRLNLRICTTSQNLMNNPKRKNSIYKGVTKTRSKKYKAGISANNKAYSLGVFATPEEAAIAYDKKAVELHGEFANLNFPK